MNIYVLELHNHFELVGSVADQTGSSISNMTEEEATAMEAAAMEEAAMEVHSNFDIRDREGAAAVDEAAEI